MIKMTLDRICQAKEHDRKVQIEAIHFSLSVLDMITTRQNKNLQYCYIVDTKISFEKNEVKRLLFVLKIKSVFRRWK